MESHGGPDRGFRQAEGIPDIEVRREQVIVVPADVLWQIVERAETLPEWLPLCDRCEVLGGEGRGRRQRMYARWGRRTAEIDQEVTEYVPHQRLTWVHTAERVAGRPAPRISKEVSVTIALHPMGAGTKVVLTSINIPNGRLGSLILRLVAAPRIRRAFDRALANLAASGGDS